MFLFLVQIETNNSLFRFLFFHSFLYINKTVTISVCYDSFMHLISWIMRTCFHYAKDHEDFPKTSTVNGTERHQFTSISAEYCTRILNRLPNRLQMTYGTSSTHWGLQFFIFIACDMRPVVKSYQRFHSVIRFFIVVFSFLCQLVRKANKQLMVYCQSVFAFILKSSLTVSDLMHTMNARALSNVQQLRQVYHVTDAIGCVYRLCVYVSRERTYSWLYECAFMYGVRMHSSIISSIRRYST